MAADLAATSTAGLEVQLAPAARHEGLGRCRVDGAGCARLLCPDLWVDAGPGARPIGGPDRDRRVLGEDDQFDRSISDFAKRYADQSELDYQAFMDAIRSGRLEALEGQ
jgi:Uncharacterized protein conserved in bacteria (DUF2252)